MVIKIGTFNAENLFLRYKFLDKMIGIGGKKVDPKDFIDEGGNINMLKAGFEDIDDIQRNNTAQVILKNNPDVICLQEVENLETLKKFNSKYLKRKYPYSMLIDGNDIRKIDVGILSKLEIGAVRTHQFDKDAKGEIFSRDCLEADIIIDKKGNKSLTVFVNHFKSMLGEDQKTSEKRERQTARVAGIIQERFGNDKNASFAVLGDFNDTPDATCLKPLLDEKNLENVVSRLPKNEQWTHYWNGETNQLDYILLSSALSKKSAGLPVIERRGLADYVKAYKGPRFPGVKGEGTEASDHCAVFMELNI
jgi:endonuclease/exonuclease/phosphatase family metal-dependent hydrolase